MGRGQLELLRNGSRIVGAGSSAIKYDILTALLAMAAQNPAADGRLALRLSLLITARFNWQSGTFSVGQKEIARLWGVTERTAKRDMAQLRARGWIRVNIPAARGRVARYEICLSDVLRDTVPYWEAVGSDFVARMTEAPETPDETNVVPLRPQNQETAPAPADGTGWQAVALRIKDTDPAVYNSWIAALQPLGIEVGVLTLLAPGKFIADYVRTHYASRLLALAVAENRDIRDVRILEPGCLR